MYQCLELDYVSPDHIIPHIEPLLAYHTQNRPSATKDVFTFKIRYYQQEVREVYMSWVSAVRQC